MNDTMNVRFAEKRDLKELVHLCELHAIFERSKYDSYQKEEQLGKYLFSTNPPLYCLVVEKDKKLIGYAGFMKQFSTWKADYYVYLDCLFLTKEYRGLGIGEHLMERIKKEGNALGCSSIQWQTPDFNKRAMKFYDRIGGTSKTKERFFLNL